MSDEQIEQADIALKALGEKLAETVRFTQEIFKKMTPEQRVVIEFLVENPKAAEAFQELNQRLARQRAIEPNKKALESMGDPSIEG